MPSSDRSRTLIALAAGTAGGIAPRAMSRSILQFA
jgi:hypothetical protein